MLTLPFLPTSYHKRAPQHVSICAASVDGAKDTMRANSGDPKMLPPQFFLGEKYLGNFEAFELAIEDEKLDVFLAGN